MPPKQELSRTGSATKVYYRNGELFAVSHKHESSKVNSNEVPFPTLTTYKSQFVKPMIVDKIQAKKPLVPYHHNAGRNRLPVHFDKEPKKCQRFCAPRNVSTIEVKDKNQRSAAKHFLSVNKCMYNKHEGVPVGFSNTGIVAEKTRWFHKRQED